MAWILNNVYRLAGVITVILTNPQEGPTAVDTFQVFYYGTGDPATDPAFTAEGQRRIAERIAGKEAESALKLDETNRFRPRATGGTERTNKDV